MVLTYDQLKAMPKQEQITQHYCIQGWSGIAKWGGVPMKAVLDIVRPLPEAKWVILYTFAHLGAGQGGYNEDHEFYGYRESI
ncbi:Putative protein-methionine-sulfoxide reductase subunit YedZ1 [Mycolicibacterium vanbaalenii]|uniref:Oxidoreductase molybdopterin-binding domain-containing protein n=1 Tax=Mycolicibacterium vanbaalenii TaxID=110539 RepID=A0A5S9R972_MYCVN|nr:Putative protein-methionine-sulfoxide reductase subunit YedZ1 [Mycolicibacterium vanbaalenii]